MQQSFNFFGEGKGGVSGFIHPSAIIGRPPEDRKRIQERSPANWENYESAYPGVAPEIHRTAVLEAYVTVDAGMSEPTRVGAKSFLMKKVHVGHDAQIGQRCDIAPMANIGGHAKVGDRVKIGMSAVILPYRKVGDGAHVGAGAVVTRDVPPGVTVVGNPARFLDVSERDTRPYTERVGS